MKLQCCFCKHIVCNVEYDGMLDCELALEEEGKPRCSNKFEKFELETDEKICTRYLNYWQHSVRDLSGHRASGSPVFVFSSKDIPCRKGYRSVPDT